MTVLYRVKTFTITIAGTPIGAPSFNTQLTPINLGDVMLHNIGVRIPNGHAGLTGVAIQVSGVNIVPFADTSSPFVVGNDDRETFTVETEVGNGLAVSQINEDFINHAHIITFEYTPIAAANQLGSITLAPVPIS